MEQKRLYSYERTRGLTLGFTCLFPLLRDAIQRSVYLNMSASMERITDLMEFDSAPLHPILAPFLRKPPLTRLKELVLDITDHAQYCCPPPSHVPNLERLTIRRAGLFPHFILAIAPDPSSDTIGFSDGDSPFFPRLSDLSLSIPALHLPSLHSFLSIHTSKLTSLTLDTKVDILRLHAEPNNPISLPSLKRLVVLHLTNLLLPHVEAWHCPSLDDLQLAWTPGLPMPTSFNVSNYPKLRRLIYGYPKTIKRPKCPGQCRIVSLAEPHDCRRVLREEELSERRAATNLLIKMLIGLQSLEHLVVMSWAFSGVWGEDDWMLRLTPKKETMEMMWLKGAAENLTEYIPPYIASKPGRPTKASFTSLRERSPIPDTDDSDGEVDRPHLISPKRSKKVDSDGIFCSDRSRLFKSRWEAKVREEEEVDVEDVWEMGKEFECPLLRSLEFRDCRGVEKSGVFRLYMARNLLFDESYSPQWCTGQQPAPATPRRNGPESLSTIYNNVVNSAAQSSHEHNPEHIALEIHAEDPVSPIRSHTDAIQPFCLKFNVSSLTLDKFYELYARYERGLYSVPIPKRRKKMLLALQTVRFGPNMHIS